MQKIILLLSAAVIFCSLNANAQTKEKQPVQLIVSANKIEEPLDKTSASVVVLDRETIVKSQKLTVAEILRTVPGIDVVTSGGPGGNTSVFMRGANSEHTLVLLNGIEINNPASSSRHYNFANLSLNNIEKIEIVLGAGGSLYGSDAIGGVISIFTKEATEQEGQAKFVSEAGSQSSFTNYVTADVGSDRAAINIFAERRDTKAFSAQANPVAAAEKDAYDNTVVGSNLKVKLDDQHDLKTYVQYSTSHADIDDGAGYIPDDPNRNIESSELMSRVELSGKYTDFKHKAGLSYTRQTLSDQDASDLFHDPEQIDSAYSGRLLKLDYLGTLQLNPSNTLIFGLETEQEAADSDNLFIDSFGTYEESFHPDSVRTKSVYTQISSQLTESLSSVQGVRFDSHDHAGDEVTYRVAPRLELSDQTALRGSWATGFKSPSLYQLYSAYGASDLEAETSRGWEVGVAHELLPDSASIEITYFRNEIENLIDFDPQTFVFNNTDSAKMSGFNTALKIKLSEQVHNSVSYSYLDTQDQDSGSSLLRRARNRLANNLDYQVSDDLSLGTEVLLVGNRFDNDFSTFPAERTKLGSYTILNLTARYRVNESLDLKARIDNIFDRHYQDVFGYNTPGFLAFGGIELKI